MIDKTIWKLAKAGKINLESQEKEVIIRIEILNQIYTEAFTEHLESKIKLLLSKKKFKLLPDKTQKQFNKMKILASFIDRLGRDCFNMRTLELLFGDGNYRMISQRSFMEFDKKLMQFLIMNRPREYKLKEAKP